MLASTSAPQHKQHKQHQQQARQQHAGRPGMLRASTCLLPRALASATRAGALHHLAAGHGRAGAPPHGLQQAQKQRQLCQTRAAAQEAGGSGAPRVVVLGGGFGGLYTAIRLTSLFWKRNMMPQITLIDQSERFVFKPLLYELLTGGADESEVAPTFLQLLAPYPVRLLKAKVTGAEPDEVAPSGASSSGGRVKLDDGTDVEYDWLVVSLGSKTNDRGIPGVKELAVPFNTLEDAQRTKAALEDIEARVKGGTQEPACIMIVGAGYSGVELAASISERLRERRASGNVRVQLLTPGADILEGSPAGQREAAAAALQALGVEVVMGARVRSLTAPEDPASRTPTAVTVDLEGGEGGGSSRAADLVLWTAGASPSTKDMPNLGYPFPRKGLPFPTNEQGSVLTEPSLRVMEHDHVFALGDVSLAGQDASKLPATAQVAFQQADYAAWNIWASINGRPLLPFRYQHLGNMMGLGNTNGAVALPFPVPPPLSSSLQASPLGPLLSTLGIKVGASGEASGADGVTLQGPLAAVARRAAYLYRQPTNEQRLNVAASWLSQAGSIANSVLASLPPTPQPGR